MKNEAKLKRKKDKNSATQIYCAHSVPSVPRPRYNVHFDFVSHSISSPFHSQLFSSFIAQFRCPRVQSHTHRCVRFTSVGISVDSTLLTFSVATESNCWRDSFSSFFLLLLFRLLIVESDDERRLCAVLFFIYPIKREDRASWPTCKVNFIIILICFAIFGVSRTH